MSVEDTQRAVDAMQAKTAEVFRNALALHTSIGELAVMHAAEVGTSKNALVYNSPRVFNATQEAVLAVAQQIERQMDATQQYRNSFL